MIDPGYTHSYITPRVVEICAFKKLNHNKSWLDQLATRTKRKVSELIEKCPLVMNGLITCVDLNVLPLGSYDVLIGMDWLEAHRVNLDCYDNTFECMDAEGNPRVVRGIPKVIFVRNISNLLTLGINKSSQPKWWEKNQEIHNITVHHSNVGNVEDATCTGIVHLRMGMQGHFTTSKKQKQWVD